MRRDRRVASAATVGLLAIPVFGFAQARKRRLGLLAGVSQNSEVARLGWRMFDDALRRLGWDDGKNVSWERRFADGNLARLDTLADQLVRADVEVIAAILAPAIAA